MQYFCGQIYKRSIYACEIQWTNQTLALYHNTDLDARKFGNRNQKKGFHESNREIYWASPIFTPYYYYF